MTRIRILFFSILFFNVLSAFSQNPTVIHVMVALCDNKYQGIVKVPQAIGNGQDPNNNLYWGALYGVRTYFRKSADWKEVERKKIDDTILERVVFKHNTKNYYLVADAYNGKNIKECTVNFLNSSSGQSKDTITVGKTVLGIHGNAKMVVYIGHNGLMDFSLTNTFQQKDNKKRDVIILACAAKQYFAPYLQSANANPILWTTNLMAPEAYTLHAAIAAYINGESNDTIREKAAEAYNKYQKCGINGARRLLVTGY